jgi:hypothetical protein
VLLLVYLGLKSSQLISAQSRKRSTHLPVAIFVRLIGDLEYVGAIFAFSPILLGPDLMELDVVIGVVVIGLMLL